MSEQQQKQANLSGDALKAAFKKVLPALVGGAGTSAAMDAMAYHGDYKNINSSRVFNALFNAMLGATGGHIMSGGGTQNIVRGAEIIGLAPVKDMAIASVPALQAYARNADKSLWDRLSTPQKYIAGGGAALGAAALVPALMSINRAAKRIAEGRSIRVSTSLRKRPNQDRDLNIGIENIQPEPAAEQSVAADVQQEPEKAKGFFGRLFGG